jgi:hypothetical protein
MPQLDPLIISSITLYTTIGIIYLIYVMHTHILPAIACNLKIRNKLSSVKAYPVRLRPISRFLYLLGNLNRSAKRAKEQKKKLRESRKVVVPITKVRTSVANLFGDIAKTINNKNFS